MTEICNLDLFFCAHPAKQSGIHQIQSAVCYQAPSRATTSNLKLFSMKRSSLSFASLLLSLSLPLVLVPQGEAASPVVLLNDTFNGTSTPNSGNLNYNLSGRQSGSLGPVPYTQVGNVQVGNGGEPHDGGNVLLCAFAANAAALQFNFNNNKSAGGLKIGFDIDPNAHNNGDLSNWGAVTLGSSEADRTTFVVSGSPHFGILFRANGRIQAFDGGSVVSPATEPNWLPDGNYSLQFHHVDLLLTDPVDGNPCDGAGDTKVEVFVDGGVAPVYSFTKTGGYANNYINFQSSDIADFDNVVITAVNPPSPPDDSWRVVAWGGDGDSGIDSSFTYTHAYNFGSANNAVINGVTFTGVNGANPAVGGSFSVTGIPNNFADDGGANVSGNSLTLARSFIYGGNPGTLTLQGLVPGRQYILTLYSKAWDAAGNRVIRFSAGASQRVVDQDTYGRNDASRNGIRIRYAYTADAGGTLVVTLAPQVGANSFHFYGFSNREGAPPPASVWTASEWTSDATSGVSPAHHYTHAYNFGSANTVTINGIPFIGNNTQNPSVPGVLSVANFFALYGGGYTPDISGAGIDLARQFIYDGRPATITVQGLTPGKRYVLSLYSASFGPPGRIINFIANGDQQTIDQDSYLGTRGIVVSYPYTADGTGAQTVRLYTVNPGWAFHLCGVANREEAAATTPVFNVQPADAVVPLGATATFTAQAAGAAPLQYQWYFGSDALAGQNSPTLQVLADFPDVAGPYSVVASNPSGSVTSRVAMLVVRLPVAGLFNTGVDASRVALADNSVDPHYSLIVNPDSVSPNCLVENSTAFPIVAGPWLANTAGAKWIGPRFDSSAAAGLATGGGIYVFRTTFDTTGLDLSSIVITGGWAIDNFGLGIRVNGAETGLTNPNGFGGLTAFTLSTANATFVNGVNTLDFVVRNDDAVAGYIGLRVQNLVGLATPPNTPPAISTQPQGQTAGTGQSATFTVVATGTSPLSYQWKLGAANILGANGPTLTLNNLTHANAGVYSVMVTNLYGMVLSSSAVLAVRDTVGGLFNTGVNPGGGALADGATDPHYALLVNPDGGSPNAIVEDSTVFPIVAGPWVANTANSKWIGPRLETSAAAGGDYTYRLIVDLTGFDPASVAVTGDWSTDNGGLDILVNGVSSGNVNAAQFVAFTPFTLTNGWTAGPNTIDFKVNNAALGYTGLRVQGIRGLGTLLPPGTRPFIVTQPQDTCANLNEISTLSVRANGSAPLTYQWYFGPDAVVDATNSTLGVFVDFPDVAGLYSVRISNGAGSTNSRMAVLSINNPPVVPAKALATSMNTPASIPPSKFLKDVTDPDGHTVSLDSVATASAQGGVIALNAGLYTYTPPSGYTGNDSFTFVVRDSCGGTTTGTMSVVVLSGALPTQNQVLLIHTANSFIVRFAGIPGHAYQIQRSTDLNIWTTIATRTAPAHGIIDYEDITGLPTAFYRTSAAP